MPSLAHATMSLNEHMDSLPYLPPETSSGPDTVPV